MIITNEKRKENNKMSNVEYFISAFFIIGVVFLFFNYSEEETISTIEVKKGDFTEIIEQEPYNPRTDIAGKMSLGGRIKK